jgi:peroxiredoxin
MESNMDNLKLKIGDKAPDFDMPSVDGKTYTLESFRGKKVLAIVFMCNHCPYVQGSIERIKQLQSDYGIKGFQVVGINANDEINYPEDSFDKMVEHAKSKNYNFVYLRDKVQSVANAYGAQCTPECFVFDEHRKLRYHGRVDDSPRDETKATVNDLRNAVDALVHNRKVPIELTAAIGCSIKWK